MKKYKLIKKYPGSPELGTIASGGMGIQFKHPNGNVSGFSSSKGKDFESLIENQPEFWEEVVEKDYEILEIVNAQIYLPDELKNLSYSGDLTAPPNIIFKLNKSKTEFDSSYCSSPLDYDTSIFYIWKVKRLSDGEVFTVGNEVYQDKVIHNNSFKISSFNFSRVTGDLLAFGGNGGISISKIKIKKQPIFTTEDGVDIYVGDMAWSVYIPEMVMYHPEGKIYNSTVIHTNHKYFSTKEAAEEYIIMNKPCLSIQDVLNIKLGSLDSLSKKLKELVKERL